MAGVTSVPDIEFTNAGLVVPTEPQILAGAQTDMNAAFGGNLNQALNTPQGQLASSLTAIIGDKNNQFLFFMNGIDPATASGPMQDALGRIYFLDRLPATSTTVNVICSGLTGVTIPIGALVQDSSGNNYQCLTAGVIPAGGAVTLPFAAVNTGPIPCPPGAITTIFQSIPGWDSASNSVAGVIGSVVESRADFEFRRQISVAANARDTMEAVYAAVINVSGVTDAYVTTNRTNASVVIDSQTLVEHSIYVAAVGGANQAIGEAIWSKVSVGCDFNGNTTVQVQDQSGYAPPAPEYDVKFTRPAALPIYFAVTVQNLSALPNATVEANIRAAIINAFNGGDGGQRARIGSTILATRYFLPVTMAATVALLSIFVGTAPNPVGVSQYVGIGNYPTITTGNISVTFV